MDASADIKTKDLPNMNKNVFYEILMLYKRGRTIKQICGDPVFPSLDVVHDWLDFNPAFRVTLRAAQSAHAESIFDDIIDIADTDVDHKRARVRIYARSLVASKYNADRFGAAKQIVEHKIDLSRLNAAKERLINVTPDSQVIDIVGQSLITTSDTTSDVDSAADNGEDIFS